MASTSSPSDPAHPSSTNSNYTTQSGTKPNTAISAITDPDFLPTLDDASTAQHLKSHFLLLSLLAGGVFSAWFMGFELFQGSQHSPWINLFFRLGSVVVVGAMLLYWTGSHYIDWWELVAAYWWLSMPVAGAVGLLLVMEQERSSGWNEVD